MYPGPSAPDLGTFVADLERALAARGHELARAVVDRRGRARPAPRPRPRRLHDRTAVPAGRRLRALPRAGRAVRRARDARSARRHGARPGRRERAEPRGRPCGDAPGRHDAPTAVVAVSDWLRTRLEARPSRRRAARREVIDCGVDLERCSRRQPGGGSEPGRLAARRHRLPLPRLADRAQERRSRLARAFERRGEGSLTFVGDGPLRPALEGRPGIHLAGAVPHAAIPDWIAAADVVCQPSLVEPFGLAHRSRRWPAVGRSSRPASAARPSS